MGTRRKISESGERHVRIEVQSESERGLKVLTLQGGKNGHEPRSGSSHRKMKQARSQILLKASRKRSQPLDA